VAGTTLASSSAFALVVCADASLALPRGFASATIVEVLGEVGQLLATLLGVLFVDLRLISDGTGKLRILPAGGYPGERPFLQIAHLVEGADESINRIYGRGGRVRKAVEVTDGSVAVDRRALPLSRR